MTARSRRSSAAVLPLALALALAGCASTGTGTVPSAGGGAGTGSGTAPSASTTGTGTGPSTAPSAGTGSSAGRTVTLDEHASGTTVPVARGSAVTVVLHSTYWSAPRSSAPSLLQPLGAASASGTGLGPSCHPGGGCGTVSTRFLAQAAGSVTLSATRTSCGEAMACSPAQRSFTVTLVITNS